MTYNYQQVTIAKKIAEKWRFFGYLIQKNRMWLYRQVKDVVCSYLMVCRHLACDLLQQ